MGKGGSFTQEKMSKTELCILVPSRHDCGLRFFKTFDKKGITSMVKFKGSESSNGAYIAVEDGTSYDGMFDKPLLCFGCGVGWLLFLLGLIFPITWFLGTVLYLSNYYKSDPRERAGLGACAAAALISTFIGSVIFLVVLFKG